MGKIAHVYTMKSLSVLEDYIEPCVSGILKAFDSVIGAASGGQAHVEMQKWLHYFASDAVGELAVCFDRIPSIEISSCMTVIRALVRAQP